MFILQLDRNDFVIKHMFNSSSGTRILASKRPDVNWHTHLFAR